MWKDELEVYECDTRCGWAKEDVEVMLDIGTLQGDLLASMMSGWAQARILGTEHSRAWSEDIMPGEYEEDELRD